MNTDNYNGTGETNTKKRLLTIKKAAKLIDGITEYRVRQMCKSGQLRCFKAGRKYLINADALYRAVFNNN